jgi:hypothetical protein
MVNLFLLCVDRFYEAVPITGEYFRRLFGVFFCHSGQALEKIFIHEKTSDGFDQARVTRVLVAWSSSRPASASAAALRLCSGDILRSLASSRRVSFFVSIKKRVRICTTIPSLITHNFQARFRPTNRLP